jgi:hypothetical protein
MRGSVGVSGGSGQSESLRMKMRTGEELRGGGRELGSGRACGGYGLWEGGESGPSTWFKKELAE